MAKQILSQQNNAIARTDVPEATPLADIDPALRQKVIDAAMPVIAGYSIIDPARVVDTPYTRFLMTSVGGTNAAALTIMQDCIDKLRLHPRYNGKVKDYFEARTNSVSEAVDTYHRRLLYPASGEPRFFSVKAMPPEERKRYGDITDADYLELWEGAGGKVYVKTWPLFTALHNKFRLAMERCGTQHAALLAWTLVGRTALDLACEVWHTAVGSLYRSTARVPLKAVEDVYRPFLLQAVNQRWQRAVNNLILDREDGNFTELEHKNIAISIAQIREQWQSMDLKTGAAIAAAEDYDDEMFRTKGERKKFVRQMSEVQQAARDEIEQKKREQRATF